MRMRIITFKLDPVLLEKLDAQAWREGCTRSEVIRRAILCYLAEKQLEQRPPARIRVIAA